MHGGLPGEGSEATAGCRRAHKRVRKRGPRPSIKGQSEVFEGVLWVVFEHRGQLAGAWICGHASLQADAHSVLVRFDAKVDGERRPCDWSGGRLAQIDASNKRPRG